MSKKLHNDGFNEEYLRQDEARALQEEINARPGWVALDPQSTPGARGVLWQIPVSYTPAGFDESWFHDMIGARFQWERVRDQEERMAAERKTAITRCNFAVQYWEDRSDSPPSWVTLAYVPMRQYGAIVGTQFHKNEGLRVRVITIHNSLSEYGASGGEWPNKIDCGTDEAPCKHMQKESHT